MAKNYIRIRVSEYGQPMAADRLTQDLFDQHRGEEVIMLVGEKKDADWLEVNARYFQFFTVFAENCPETLDKHFGIKGVEDLNDRVFNARKATMALVGEIENVSYFDVKAEEMRIETVPRSLATYKTARAYGRAYAKCRDYVFSALFEAGWNEKDLKRVFDVLYTK